MHVRLLTSAADIAAYEAWLAGHPRGSLWQSLHWKRLQEALGRTVRLYGGFRGEELAASGLVVIDRTSLGLSTWDIPRGPLGSPEGADTLLRRIEEDARKERALALYFSPLDPLPRGKPSGRFVYPEATRIVDLRGSEEDLLARMKPKGRYNVRLAEKHGVEVARSHDVEAYASLSKRTAKRDGFRPQAARTYRAFLETLPGSFLLLAYAPGAPTGDHGAGAPIAGLLGLIWGTRGIYYYGASSDEHRNLMAPYLLQWEAMRLCKAAGCESYDLFGIAPEGAARHPWAGVTEFKAKFGGTIEAYPPERTVTTRPLAKAALGLKRKLLG